MKKEERILLYTLGAGQFANIMDFMIMMPLGPQLMRIFQIDAQQFSLLVASYTVSAGISGFMISFVADRFDRKRLLLTMFGGFIVGTFLCALAPNYHALLGARVGTGLFGGVLGSVVMAIVSDVIPMQRRAAAMGIITASFSMASVFGVPFGLFLANAFSWHAPFLFLVALSIPVWFLIRSRVPKVDAHLTNERQKPLAVLGAMVKNNNQLLALGFISMLLFSHFAIIPFLSPSMVANVGFTEAQLFWIYFLGGGISIITGPYFGRLADRIGKQKVFRIALVCSLFPILWITHMGRLPLPVALLGTMAFFVFAGGRMIPAMAVVSGTVSPRSRGSFMSIQSSLQNLAVGLAAFVAGLIVKKDASGTLLHYPWVGYISVIGSILCLFLIGKIKVIDQGAEVSPHE